MFTFLISYKYSAKKPTQRLDPVTFGNEDSLSRLEKVEKKSQEVQDSGETKIKIWLKKCEKVKKKMAFCELVS